MVAIRVTTTRGLSERFICPGDTLVAGELLVGLNTVGGGLVTAQGIISGITRRGGNQTAVFTDTTDTAANILSLLLNNTPQGLQGNIVQGNSWRWRYINTSLYTATVLLGTGISFGPLSNQYNTVAASAYRDYLFTVGVLQPTYTDDFTVQAGSNIALLNLNSPGQNSFGIGISPEADNTILAGCSASGTGIPAGTTVLGTILGQGGLIGVTLSSNVTASSPFCGITFGPTLQIDSLGAGPN